MEKEPSGGEEPILSGLIGGQENSLELPPDASIVRPVPGAFDTSKMLNDQSYDWFPGLSEKHRKVFKEIFAGALEEALVNRWFDRIRTSYHIGPDTLKARLIWLGINDPLPPQAPSIAKWLGYGLATNSIGDKHFQAYVRALSVPDNPISEEWWQEITQATEKLWGDHAERIDVILPHWYRHILQQLELRQYSVEPIHNSLSLAFRTHDTPDAASVFEMQSSASVSGLVFTGPAHTTLLLARSSHNNMELTKAHLTAHCLRADVRTGHFDLWVEYYPGKAPRRFRYDVNHFYAEEVADDLAVSLLEPLLKANGLTPGGRRLIIACVEMGLPKTLVRALLWLRIARQMEPLPLRLFLNKARRLLLRQLNTLYFPRPGALVCGNERHVYLLDASWHKHWIASKMLLYASRYPKDIIQVPDDRLKQWPSGPHIYTIKEMQRMHEQLRA